MENGGFRRATSQIARAGSGGANMSSFPAGQHENAEQANECVLEVRVVIHDDGYHAHVRQVAHCASDDMFLVEPPLVCRIPVKS